MAASIAEIERELAELRDASTAPGQAPNLRTSVLTHLAWVPTEWQEAAEMTLAGLAERHPSRTILLFPQPEEPDGLDMDASVQCFPIGDKSICAEVIRVRLRGDRALHPASVLTPLLVPDLMTFCRWRGLPPFDEVFDEVVGVVDRLIVDSTEWPNVALSRGYGELVRRFERTIVSDIAWARTERWRRELAQAWPFEGRTLAVTGTYAQALLLTGWLRSRLGHDVEVEHQAAESLLAVSVDGSAIDAPPGEPPLSSDLLSDELETYTRNPVYEAAVAAGATS
jgi:glucose-6-phosphate dehydrogenase assembly protein OpcA